MTDPAVTIDRLQAFQVSLNVAAQIALDLNFVVGNRVNDLVDLLRRQILGAGVRVDVSLLEDPARTGETDPVNIGQRRFDALVRWYFNSE